MPTEQEASPQLGFGQPMGGLIQMAYVVADARAAALRWTQRCKAGPWFILDGLAVPDGVYRGEPCDARANVALGFAGHLQIELIEPLGDTASIHRESVLRSGYGFHHRGIASADPLADAAALASSGHREVFRATVPTGGTVVYLESDDEDAGFLELIPVTPMLDDVFTSMWRASLGWTRDDPLRPFHSLLAP